MVLVERRVVVYGVSGYENIELGFSLKGFSDALNIPPLVRCKIHNSRPGVAWRDADFVAKVLDCFMHF